MSYASVEGIPCPGAELTVPLTGAWVLSASAAQDLRDLVDGTPVSAVFGDLSLRGTVFREGSFVGTGQVLVVGGAGGWRKRVPPKFYSTPFGVRAADVVADAARECGEAMASPASGSPGRFWVRAEGPASDVLNLLSRGWWVGFDGRTVPGPRTGGTVVEALNAQAAGTSFSEGVLACSPALLAAVLPGMTVVSPTVAPRTVSNVVHTVAADKVRSRLWLR